MSALWGLSAVCFALAFLIAYGLRTWVLHEGLKSIVDAIRKERRP